MVSYFFHTELFFVKEIVSNLFAEYIDGKCEIFRPFVSSYITLISTDLEYVPKVHNFDHNNCRISISFELNITLIRDNGI